jgi:hypothetical protein
MGDAPDFDNDLDAERTVLRRASSPRADVAAERSEHSLVVVRGGEPGRRFRFAAEVMLIGRKEPADWVLADLEISARHCQVSANPQRANATVTDLQSTNGTFVNDKRVVGSAPLPNGALLRIGDHVLKHEYRPWKEAELADRLERDLERARHYVEVLLPAPIRSGPVRTEWFFMPSAKLGGDAFGHQQLDGRSFSCYLVDVSGHGAGAAMHGVSIMNVLRQQALPNTDFRDPSQVLEALNAMFQMEQHAGMYFSIWYGVYDLATRQLSFASGGHHPAYLRHAAFASLLPLQTRNLVIGARLQLPFRSDRIEVPAGAVLYLFSDGVFEVLGADGQQRRLEDLLPLLQAPPDELPEPERIYKAVRRDARPGPLDDDFSLLTVTFL